MVKGAAANDGREVVNGLVRMDWPKWDWLVLCQGLIRGDLRRCLRYGSGLNIDLDKVLGFSSSPCSIYQVLASDVSKFPACLGPAPWKMFSEHQMRQGKE